MVEPTDDMLRAIEAEEYLIENSPQTILYGDGVLDNLFIDDIEYDDEYNIINDDYKNYYA